MREPDKDAVRRFFSDDSYWNRPIGNDPPIYEKSSALLAFMSGRDPRGFWINLRGYTIPVYEVGADTPRRKVYRRFEQANAGPPVINAMRARSKKWIGPNHPLGHGRDFAEDAAAGRVPLPVIAKADPKGDAHIALVDWNDGWIWDMFCARRRADGDWESYTGMKYRADGSGVFKRSDFAVHNGESIHLYGPGRAAGVPILAGLIMHQEVVAGRIRHKLGFATQAAALQRFLHPPASWTDGGWRDGIPEGAVLQLNPRLDPDTLGLSPGARTVARALQGYGAVCVDVALGHVLYGEGLYADPHGRTWNGFLDENDLAKVDLKHFRVLKMENVTAEGQGPRPPDGIYGDRKERDTQRNG